MFKLVLIRHGESTWNQENRFTGWTDVDLNAKGLGEAKAAGQLLKKEGYTFDRSFVSVLKRALRTNWMILDELDELWIPVERSWRLNERHYGSLQGLNKSETAAKFGDEQVLIWRARLQTLLDTFGYAALTLDGRERQLVAMRLATAAALTAEQREVLASAR